MRTTETACECEKSVYDESFEMKTFRMDNFADSHSFVSKMVSFLKVWGEMFSQVTVCCERF